MGNIRNSLHSDRRIASSSFAGVSLSIERRQVSPLRSETPPLRFGPSGDCARRSAKKSAQEEENGRKSAANLYDNVTNHTSSHTRTLSRRRSRAAS
jgi:hypothetical protein